MALLPVGLMAVGTGLQAYGQLSSGQAQVKAQQQNVDASIAEAKNTLAQGQFEAARTRYQGGRLTSAQEAAYGAAGVTLSGSPLEVMKESSAQNELDAMTQEYNAKIGANRSLSQASYQSKMAMAQNQSTLINAGSTLLTGAGSLALRYGGTKIPKSTNDLPDPTTFANGLVYGPGGV